MKNSLLLSIILLFAFLSFAQSTRETGGVEVGETAPAINGTDIFGKDFDWNKTLEKGPIVVVFYRGSWCPYCNVYLASIVKRLPEIQEKATVLAITPQYPEKIDETVKLRNIMFPVIYDESAEIIKSWKSVSQEESVGLFQSRNYDVKALPVPATYIVSKDGKVTKRHFDENYKNRMDIDEMLAELETLQ